MIFKGKSTMGSSTTTALSLSFGVFVSLVSCVHCLDHQYWITELLSANQRFNSPENRDLQTSTFSQAACESAKATYEVNGAEGERRVLCICDDVADGTSLFCVDSCNLCTDDITSCGLQSFGFQFNAVGGVGGLKLGFQYITGGDEIVFIDYTNCQTQDGAISCDDCSVDVDGTTCNSCAVTTCEDGTQGSQFTCGVVEPGSNIDTCDQNRQISDESVFHFLTLETGNFDTCVPEGTPIPPTAAPVNPPPSDCKVWSEICVANTDCCSGRCFGGVCRTSISSSRAKKGAVKLSKNRGGAGGGGSRPGARRKLGNNEKGEISLIRGGGGQRFGRIKGV